MSQNKVSKEELRTYQQQIGEQIKEVRRQFGENLDELHGKFVSIVRASEDRMEAQITRLVEASKESAQEIKDRIRELAVLDTKATTGLGGRTVGHVDLSGAGRSDTPADILGSDDLETEGSQSRAGKSRDWLKFSLKSFDGSSSGLAWAEFISKFNTCCHFNSVPEINKVAVLDFYLQGIPKGYYDDLVKGNPRISYKDLCTAMQTKLASSQGSDQVALEISLTRQQPGESVKEYFERF